MRPSIPVPIIKDLRCGHCRKFVTCGPVHMTPDSSILCGRCFRFAKKTYRNYAFEALASIYQYPCHYWPQHCNKKLIWNDSLDHERNCLFKSSCNVFCSRPGTFFKSERKLPSGGDVSYEHVTEEILEQLKCIACESYLSNNPVYMVIDGKNVCHRCCHSNGVPKNAIRNLAYEKIAASIIFPCIYRFRGCTIRLKFGRDMWAHEHDCPYGQINQKLTKKPSTSKGGKERGVIETHSGHVWGTITPHSALFAPPKSRHDGKIVTQELAEVMKRKQKEETEGKSFDSQSVDSVNSKSTFDSLADNISRDNLPKDNISRSTGDNISRDNVSRSTADNISRDNVSRSSSRPPTREEDHRYFNDTSYNEDYRASVSGYSQQKPSYYQEMSRLQKIRKSNDDLGLNYGPYRDEVAPLPTPPGYNKVPFNGYYQENMARYARPSNLEQYSHLYHYPPIYVESSPNLNHSTSFNYPQNQPSAVPVQRSESLRVGNQGIINELKERQSKKMSLAGQKEDNNPYGQCNNLQEIVQRHDELI